MDNLLKAEESILSIRAKRKLEKDLGPLFMKAWADPKAVEVMLNADGSLWQERLGEEMQCIGSMSPNQAESIIKTIASYHGKEITTSNPIFEGEFPIDNSRFAGQMPPVVQSTTFAIRKKAVSIFSLEEYVEKNILTNVHYEHIKKAISEHKNILVIGGTSSGKTTLINAIIKKMVETNPSERVIIIEDTGEIQCAAKNYIQFHTSLEVSMTILLKTSLRMRPDRILIGEVRGPEALDLLMAWNTGHEGGAATLHSNNAESGLSRLAMLISMHPNAPRIIEPLIAEVVHFIVHISKTPQGRKVKEVLEISGYENGKFLTRKL